MIELTFRIQFSSDWHISASYGETHEIDSVIERDKNNRSFIRAATLKGLFREALQDMQGFVSLTDKRPPLVLGEAGVEGKWQFTDASLIGSIDRRVVVTGVRVDPRLRRAEEGKLYTREMGAGGSTFEFTIRGNGSEKAEEEVEWLVAASRLIRRLGNRRRRGSGACEVSLEPQNLQNDILENFIKRQKGETPSKISLPRVKINVSAYKETTEAKRFRIYLRTDSPLVIGSTPEAGNTYQGQIFIPGRTIRGAFGTLSYSNVQQDDLFNAFFMLGQASFSAMYPILQNTILDELPDGLFRYKDEIKVISALLGDNTQDAKKYRGFYRLGYKEALEDPPKELSLQTKMHVSIENTIKRSRTGELYSYEAIPPQTYYVGELYLKEKTWQEFSEITGIALEQPFELMMGKGRRRGYGQCTLWIEAIEDNTSPLWCPTPLENRLSWSNDRDHVYILTFASDTILVDDWGRAGVSFQDKSDSTVLKNYFETMLGLNQNTIEIRKENIRSKIVDGFDTRSGLPAWRDIAIIKGSSVAFEFIDKASIKPKDLERWAADIEKTGVGLRRSEGFGRVVFNHPAYFDEFEQYIPDISIPEILLSEVAKELDFIGTWKAYLTDELAGKPFDAQEYRSLARYLVEFMTNSVDEMRSILDNRLEKLDYERFGLSKAYDDRRNADRRKKEPRIPADVKSQIIKLLDYLQKTYPDHWQQGLVILAQTINESVGKKEKSS